MSLSADRSIPLAVDVMPAPALSVVIPSVNGLADLVGCLEAVERLRESVTLETIVVDRLGTAVADLVCRRFPWIRLISVEPGTPIPMMRHRGFESATGGAVAVIEDHVLVPPDWGRLLLEGLARGHAVVGGPITNTATDRVVDWATFLCEYSHCLPPWEPGPAEWLPGTNVAYRREVLERYRAVTGEGRWEVRLHNALRTHGIVLQRAPEIVVMHKQQLSTGEYCSQRYWYSRSYAGARGREVSTGHRLALGLGALLCPPLLLFRNERTLREKGVAGSLRWRTLPYRALFVIVWGVGDAIGYWFGAGDSMARVR